MVLQLSKPSIDCSGTGCQYLHRDKGRCETDSFLIDCRVYKARPEVKCQNYNSLNNSFRADFTKITIILLYPISKATTISRFPPCTHTVYVVV